jgi:hypothetical protein
LPLVHFGFWRETWEKWAAEGHLTAEEARAIRAEGEQAIKLIQANQSPFCDGWERWLSPVEWEIPVLPANWGSIAIDDDSS